MKQIKLTVNGALYELEVQPSEALVDVIRDKLGLTGTKEGCGLGECGACTVIMDGKPVNSCLVLAVEADGREVTTVEGLAREGQLSVLQEAFVARNAVQCGFCTPGMLISAHALLERNPHPTEDEIRKALVGNLCRCTGYVRIVQAVQVAAEKGGAK